MPAMISRGCAQPGSGKTDTDAVPKFNVTRTTPHSAENIFAIVAAVGSYKEFLPLMTQSRVMHRKTLPDGRESFDATTTIVHDKLRIHETMHSHVIVDRESSTVTAHSADGPLKSLDTRWVIRPLSNGGSEIEFSVDYALKSRSLQFLLSGMFDLVVRKIMNAFEARADELYGSRSASS